jgi:hypothetical protein
MTKYSRDGRRGPPTRRKNPVALLHPKLSLSVRLSIIFPCFPFFPSVTSLVCCTSYLALNSLCFLPCRSSPNRLADVLDPVCACPNRVSFRAGKVRIARKGSFQTREVFDAFDAMVKGSVSCSPPVHACPNWVSSFRASKVRIVMKGSFRTRDAFDAFDTMLKVVYIVLGPGERNTSPFCLELSPFLSVLCCQQTLYSVSSPPQINNSSKTKPAA